MSDSHGIRRLQEISRELLIATEKKAKAEIKRLEELKEIKERISEVYRILCLIQEMILNDIEEKRGLVRVHKRIDDHIKTSERRFERMETKLNELAEKISAIDVSRKYQDKSINLSEGRFYNFITRWLPVFGVIVAAGAIIIAVLSGSWGIFK